MEKKMKNAVLSLRDEDPQDPGFWHSIVGQNTLEHMQLFDVCSSTHGVSGADQLVAPSSWD